MSTVEALQDAIGAMQAVIDVSPITDPELTNPTPCADFNVEQLVAHIMDTHELLLSAAGGAPPRDSGSLSERHAAIGAASVAQWSSRGTDATIHLGGNELPAAFGLSLHALEIYIHAWDLATSLNRPFTPTEKLTDQMWDFAHTSITNDVRGDSASAPYGPAIEPESTADLADRIIALSGRDPHCDPHCGTGQTPEGRASPAPCGA